MSEIILTVKQKGKLSRAVKALNDVRSEIQLENPDSYINWYLEDSNNLNLMEDDPHDDRLQPRRDRVIELFEFEQASGGGW